MDQSSRRRILFVVNPKSNKNAKDEIKNSITELKKELKPEWKIYTTKGENDPENIRKILDWFEPDTVVAAGGDGTVNLVGRVLFNRNINMGIIPEGSANGLAFNLNIPNNTKNAIKQILKSDPKPIDMIRINEKHYCLHLSDIGINARIVKRFEKEGDKGLLGYGKQMVRELFSRNNDFSFRLKTDHQEKACKAEMLVIANAQSYGTGAVINPTGNIIDGNFEIVVIKPYPWWIVFSFIFMFFTGNLHKMKYVNVISTPDAQITLDKPRDLQVDGEIFSNIRSLNIQIHQRAINIYY